MLNLHLKTNRQTVSLICLILNCSNNYEILIFATVKVFMCINVSPNVPE